MLDGPGRRLHGCGCQRGRPVASDHHPAHPGASGAPQEGTEVARVCHTIEHEQEGAGGRARHEQVVERRRHDFVRPGDHALGSPCERRIGKCLGRSQLDLDTPFVCELDDLGERGIAVVCISDPEPERPPTPSRKELMDCVVAFDLVAAEGGPAVRGPPVDLSHLSTSLSHLSSISTTARHATPSWRPSAPSPRPAWP